jgi:hypothetical protein
MTGFGVATRAWGMQWTCGALAFRELGFMLTAGIPGGLAGTSTISFGSSETNPILVRRRCGPGALVRSLDIPGPTSICLPSSPIWGRRTTAMCRAVQLRPLSRSSCELEKPRASNSKN